MRHTATVDAVSPVRFDHRFIRKCLDLAGFSDPVTNKEYEMISRVFTRLGGSWESIVKGDPKSIHTLKTVIKFAVKNGHVGNKG